MEKYYVANGDYAELKDGSKYYVDYCGKMKRKDGSVEWYIILSDSKNVFKLNKTNQKFIYSYDLKEDFNKIGKYDFTKEKENKIMNIVDELDNIIIKCRTNVKEKDLFLARNQYDKYDYMYEGYRSAMYDVIDLIRELNKKVKSETPPCTGSSVQKKEDIKPLEIKPKYEEKVVDKLEFFKDGVIMKTVACKENILVGAEEVSNLDIVTKINEIIKVVNGGK